MLKRWWAKLREVWRKARSEHASPRQIGLAFGLGVFCGCTPAIGFHGWVAIAAATLVRLNRLWAWLGSRISNIVILPFIVYAEIDVAHWLRTGETVVFDRKHVIREAHLLFLDWCIGCVIVGLALGIALGTIAWGAAALKSRLARAPEPSSGSPPSD